MGAICAPDNLEAALCTVVRKKGAPGVDGITVAGSPQGALARDRRSTAPEAAPPAQPVLRVKIPKPDGGMPNLEIPTVIDRVIPTGAPAAASAAMGPDIQQAQLWL